jgi:hypothetical protein
VDVDFCFNEGVEGKSTHKDVGEDRNTACATVH